MMMMMMMMMMTADLPQALTSKYTPTYTENRKSAYFPVWIK